MLYNIVGPTPLPPPHLCYYSHPLILPGPSHPSGICTCFTPPILLHSSTPPFWRCQSRACFNMTWGRLTTQIDPQIEAVHTHKTLHLQSVNMYLCSFGTRNLFLYEQRLAWLLAVSITLLLKLINVQIEKDFTGAHNKRGGSPAPGLSSLPSSEER